MTDIVDRAQLVALKLKAGHPVPETMNTLWDCIREIERLKAALTEIDRRCSDYEHINHVGSKKAGTIRNVALIAANTIRKGTND